jgi:predicted aspartyl protease
MNWRILVCLLLLWPKLVSAACEVRQLAVVPLEIAGTVVLTPVMVNGIPGTFILDTGAAQTVVTPDAVSHFGLALDEWTASTMRGVGGIERRRNADPR